MTSPGRMSLVFALLAVGAGIALAQEEKKAPDGKDLFLAAKCNTCHSVTAAKIEKKKPTAEEAAAASKEKPDPDEKKPPDLSSVGLDKKADWIAKFITKKETLEGEKHKKLYKGTDEELKTLSTWLESQKAPKKKSSK
jgi:cytochrome c1